MSIARDPLGLHYDFDQLSISDLLRARDTYHFHLMNKRNVVGTAVGYYLIRNDDPRSDDIDQNTLRQRNRPERTFWNSSVRDTSWPCVLVMVSSWEYADQFGVDRAYDPTDMVPKTLYLDDGRAVPVCVVAIKEKAAAARAPIPAPAVAPSAVLGGGQPITVTIQGMTYTATAGCLVSDGHYTYALTAGHVCGAAGTRVASELRSGVVEIGESTGNQLTHVEFSKAYPDFPGRRSFSTVDAGLIRLDDLTRWTSNTYGLPALGQMEDVHEHNLTLRIVDRNVIGYGAASGLVEGTIKALFYRYRSVGGFDYIGDFLISPKNHESGTQHGDSGMIWNLDLVDESTAIKATEPLTEPRFRPLAMQWGGQVLRTDDGEEARLAVATSLSTVCRLLNVELVTDLSRGVQGYWGRVGHYSIAAYASALVRDPDLRQFLTSDAVRKQLSFDLSTIRKGKAFEDEVFALSSTNKFVPLADVPDEIWKKLPPPLKNTKRRIGGRDSFHGGHLGVNGPEHPNHYADIDAPFGPAGETWRQLCLRDSDRLSVEHWQKFYSESAQRAEDAGDAATAKQYREPLKQGLLPFRVWQIFSAMTGFVQQGDLTGFLAAAGILAHYVGDASQPLHGSIFADGDPSRPVDRLNEKGDPAHYGEGVHSAFESEMVTRHAGDLVDLIDSQLADRDDHGLTLCRNGKGAAKATLKLMDDAAAILPPAKVLDSFEANLSEGKVRVATLDAMWQELGEATSAVMIAGAASLAMLWDAAWHEGGGHPGLLSGAAPRNSALTARYIDASFLPSCVLDNVGEFLS